MHSLWRNLSSRWFKPRSTSEYITLFRWNCVNLVQPTSSLNFRTSSRGHDRNTYHDTRPNGWFNKIVALGLVSGFLVSDEIRALVPFPVKVQCAQVTKPLSKKDRQSAIQALDVIADVAEEAQPAVVSVTSMDKGIFARHTQSTGSGFIIDSAGHVVTNAHVVGYRSSVVIHLSDGRSFPAQVLALDVSSDLALVKLEVSSSVGKSLPQLPLAENLKSVRPGHFVLALGSPLMLANSVTVGVISALDRDLGHSEGLKYIQTDAIITFGNSGGPLVSLAGEVIGVNSMVAGTGVGFAIPVDQVRRFVELALKSSKGSPTVKEITPRGDSKAGGEVSRETGPQRRYLGLVMRTLTPALAFELASRGGPYFADVTEGVLIQAVMRNSPAQRAGLQAGDIVIAIDGAPITNAHEIQDAAETRDELSMTIIRRGQKFQITGIRTEKV